MKIDGFGIAIDLPAGWDGRIWKAPEGVEDIPGSSKPVLHAANFRLPDDRSDFGWNSIGAMKPGQVFMALKEYGPSSAGKGRFSPSSPPAHLRVSSFAPAQMERLLPNRAGLQSFFTISERPFCLHVAAWMPISRPVLDQLRAAVAAIEVHPLIETHPAVEGARYPV